MLDRVLVGINIVLTLLLLISGFVAVALYYGG